VIDFFSAANPGCERTEIALQDKIDQRCSVYLTLFSLAPISLDADDRINATARRFELKAFTFVDCA
jgi:hypothetical protein